MIAWQLSTAGPALATAGDLDPSFGLGGIVTTDFNDSTDLANALVIQADGKLVTAGSTTRPESPADFGLTRYTRNGRLDMSFGTGGKVTTDFFGSSDFLHALVAQADGKLVAAGVAFTGSGANREFALARYNPDGTLDTTFGTGGKVTTSFAGNDSATALALQADGNLVAAGSTYDSSSGISSFALARYNPDGTLDPTFGTGGKVIGPAAASVGALVVQTDGKLVAAGSVVVSSSDFVLARYNSDGTLDSTFGVSGTVTTDFAGDSDVANALVVQTDGRLVAAGSAVVSAVLFNVDFALARYNTDGTLDTGFGTGGRVTTDFVGMTDTAHALVVQSGMLVAAGTATIGDQQDFALARYNPDGTLDAGFGTGGKVSTDITGSETPRSVERVNALAVQDSGKLVAAGIAAANLRFGISDFGLARYRAR